MFVLYQLLMWCRVIWHHLLSKKNWLSASMFQELQVMWLACEYSRLPLRAACSVPRLLAGHCMRRAMEVGCIRRQVMWFANETVIKRIYIKKENCQTFQWADLVVCFFNSYIFKAFRVFGLLETVLRILILKWPFYENAIFESINLCFRDSWFQFYWFRQQVNIMFQLSGIKLIWFRNIDYRIK